MPSLHIDSQLDAPRAGRLERRYTRDGSESLEAQIRALCHSAAARVRTLFPARTYAGLVLGGGYGRGEGGVLHTPEGDRPYNDLEFYLFVRGPAWLFRKAWGRRLHAVEEQLSARAGIDVEFHLLSSGHLQRARPSMFYYDLLMGHRVVEGRGDLLAGCPHLCDPAAIPASEASRLLMNRGTGLLFSRMKLEGSRWSQEEADFVERNLAKACLAMGDAWLALHGKYHWSCLERHRLLVEHTPPELPEKDQVLELHARGVAFKLHPFRSERSRVDLARDWDHLQQVFREVFLAVESRRLGQPLASIDSYLDARDRWPETGAMHNLLRRMKWSGLHPIGSARHPRHALLGLLAGLLWSPLPLPQLMALTGRELRKIPETVAEARTAYVAGWRIFN